MKTPANHVPHKKWEIYRSQPGEWVVQWNCRIGNEPFQYCGSRHMRTWAEARDVWVEWAK